MDITDITNKSQPNILQAIDAKITLQFLKEKKTSRTYIIGLEDFIEASQITKFVNSLKASLGTSSYERIIDEKKCYGFQGNHIETIRQKIISELKIDKKKIKG
jgi:hypothetical protein